MVVSIAICEILEFREGAPRKALKIHITIYQNKATKMANGPILFHIDAYMKMFYECELKTVAHGMLVFLYI